MPEIAFPPRDETLDFFKRLNREKYAGDDATNKVDLEGIAVWVQEYLRHRVNGKNHIDAAVAVFQEIDRVRGGAQHPRPPASGNGPRPMRVGITRLDGLSATKYQLGETLSTSVGVIDVDGAARALSVIASGNSGLGAVNAIIAAMYVSAGNGVLSAFTAFAAALAPWLIQGSAIQLIGNSGTAGVWVGPSDTLSLYGVTPVARQLLPTTATNAQIATALNNLGATRLV